MANQLRRLGIKDEAAGLPFVIVVIVADGELLRVAVTVVAVLQDTLINQSALVLLLLFGLSFHFHFRFCVCLCLRLRFRLALWLCVYFRFRSGLLLLLLVLRQVLLLQIVVLLVGVFVELDQAIEGLLGQQVVLGHQGKDVLVLVVGLRRGELHCQAAFLVVLLVVGLA